MSGYNRTKIDDIRAAAQQVVVNLSESIKANGGVQNATRDPVPLPNESKPADPIYPTDLMADTGVKIEPLPDVPVYDPNKPTDQPPQDPSVAVENHEKNINNYMEADQRIKSEFIAELKNVDPEVGAAVEGAMPTPGGTSGLTMLGSLADDAIIPGAGDIWRAIDDIMSQTSNPNNKRVQDAIAQTISNLQSQVAENVQRASNTPGAPQPIRWDKLHPDPVQAVNQMQNFLMRDPKEDPLMQIAMDNVPKLERMEQNFKNFQEVHMQALGKVTAEVVAQHAEAGDRSTVQKMLGGSELATELAMQGDVDAAMTGKAPTVTTSWELDARLKGADIAGVKAANDDIFDLDESVKSVAKALAPANKIADPKIAPVMESAFG